MAQLGAPWPMAASARVTAVTTAEALARNRHPPNAPQLPLVMLWVSYISLSQSFGMATGQGAM